MSTLSIRTGGSSRHRLSSRGSRSSKRPDKGPHSTGPNSVFKKDDWQFDACAATASFVLYAQRNVIFTLHHDTLAIDRRFERHHDEVLWIATDTVSENGAGRLAVSYDSGQTALVWDIFTGDEVARFVSYEHIRTAAWMRNGNIAFGNAQGNVITFEPHTSEHTSTRTIFDPITALAPARDCSTFAIGYLNGSILIATLQPAFTMLHTLTTARGPSPIAHLAWHGSSAKQKSDMLATQTCDGDLRVWSIPKTPHTDPPSVIRILNRSDTREPGPCWFAWSKNGRIVQQSEGETRAWDVRTKRVSYEIVPTIENIVAITNYGPSATLFTLGQNNTVQQYDLSPDGTPVLVANVQHTPSTVLPTPPSSVEEDKVKNVAITHKTVSTVPILLEADSTDDDGLGLSPLQKIAMELDDERRDRLGPLSPVSSRGSVNSRSSNGRRGRYDNMLTNGSSQYSDRTTFSRGSSIRPGSDGVSIRSLSSTSSLHQSTGLRKEVPRSPDEPIETISLDLFPYLRTRLEQARFRPPQPLVQPTADELRQQMLDTVFGWSGDTEGLIRDEIERHPVGSAGAVLLTKWLGDTAADMMMSVIGSRTMTSSDWMLLALSSMGHDSQRKVGEAFVRRLLDKGDIHPAVAILLGLGEPHEAINVYIVRKRYMEAILLTCLLFPTDWPRQSALVRKWGEVVVAEGKPELAVRCFSCTSIDSPGVLSSPRTQDSSPLAPAYSISLTGLQNPPLSSPSIAGSANGRLSVKNSALKLITDFGDQEHGPILLSTDNSATPMGRANGMTPIFDLALSPAAAPWSTSSIQVSSERTIEELASARGTTPQGTRRKRRDENANRTTETSLEMFAKPSSARGRVAGLHSGASRNRSRATSIGGISTELSAHPSEPITVVSARETRQAEESGKKKDLLPSPTHGVFASLKNREPGASHSSREKKPGSLRLDLKENHDTISTQSFRSGGLTTLQSETATSLTSVHSPPWTGSSLQNMKKESIDRYINSLEEAGYLSQNDDTTSYQRPRSRVRETSEGRTRQSKRRGRSAKKSPISPAPMSLDHARHEPQEPYDDERFYRMLSPTDTSSVKDRGRSSARDSSKARSGSRVGDRVINRTASRHTSPDRGLRVYGKKPTQMNKAPLRSASMNAVDRVGGTSCR